MDTEEKKETPPNKLLLYLFYLMIAFVLLGIILVGILFIGIVLWQLGVFNI